MPLESGNLVPWLSPVSRFKSLSSFSLDVKAHFLACQTANSVQGRLETPFRVLVALRYTYAQSLAPLGFLLRPTLMLRLFGVAHSHSFLRPPCCRPRVSFRTVEPSFRCRGSQTQHTLMRQDLEDSFHQRVAAAWVSFLRGFLACNAVALNRTYRGRSV